MIVGKLKLENENKNEMNNFELDLAGTKRSDQKENGEQQKKDGCEEVKVSVWSAAGESKRFGNNRRGNEDYNEGHKTVEHSQENFKCDYIQCCKNFCAWKPT